MTLRPTGPTPTPTTAPAPAPPAPAGTPVLPYASPSPGGPAAAAPPAPAPPAGRRPGLTGIRLTVGLTVLLTAGLVALILVRWVNSRFPSSFIQFVPQQVSADRAESVEGVEVTVSDSRHDIDTIQLHDGKD